MVVRIKVTLEQEEYSGLLKLALSEMRNPQEQMRFMLWQELKHLGLLQEDGIPSAKRQNRTRNKRKKNGQTVIPASSSKLEDFQGERKS